MTSHNVVNLTVEGMHCVNCAQTVEKSLRALGLETVSVDFASSQASVVLPSSIGVDVVHAAIERAGFRVTGPQASLAPTPWYAKLESLFVFCLLWTVPLMAHMFIDAPILHDPWFQFCLATPVFLVGLVYFGKSALGALRAGTSNMDVLIIVGVIAAYAYSTIGMLLHLGHGYLFFETAATIITIVLFGNVLEKRAIRRTTSAIQELSRLQTGTARKIVGDGPIDKVFEIDASEVIEGDNLLVNTGDRVPADGIIVSGDALVDESMISGESVPVEKQKGNPVVGGTIVFKGSFRMRATAIGEKSVLASIIRLVREAQTKRPQIQRLGDLVSSYFVPAVALIAVTTFGLSLWYLDLGFQESLLRAIAVLVVACPCAMGLATPTAVMVGLGKAARSGILVKGGDTLEQCAAIQKIIFDKTGTLTTGRFQIEKIDVFARDLDFVRSALVALEQHSSHPIARSLLSAFAGQKPLPLHDVQEIKGLGISGFHERTQLRVGSKLILPKPLAQEYDLHLFEDETLVAGVKISDEVKPFGLETINQLRERHIAPVLLSGDRKEKCQTVARVLGISEIYAEQQPEDKVTVIERIEKSMPAAFVGDGINDAPSLSRSRVGISLSTATQAAIESAHVVLLRGELEQIVKLVDISRATLRTIKQNLFWAFFYNVLMIPMAAMGLLTPTLAAFSMAFSDVVVILNSLRLKARKF